MSRVSRSPAAEVPARSFDPLGGPREYSLRWILVFLVTDAVAFLGASYLATLVIDGSLDFQYFEARLYSASIFVAFWLVFFWQLGLYRRTFALSVRDEVYFGTVALCLGALPQLVLFTLAPSLSTSRSYILASLLFAIIIVNVNRAVLHMVATRHVRESCTLWSSADPRIEAELGLTSLGRVRFCSLSTREPAKLVAAARAARASKVVIAELLPPADVQLLHAALSSAGITLLLAPPSLLAWNFDFGFGRVGDQVLLETRPLKVCTATADLTKRLMDLAIGSVALLFSFPVMLLAAALILIDSGRPVIFRQERIGRHGQPFTMFKFRTMWQDAGSAFPRGLGDDHRITRVGALLRKTSIDELPQFFNVLRGEMSVVGPRPEMTIYAAQFAQTIPRYTEIHQVRPGITCWGAVHMSRVIAESDASRALAHDLFYLQHWSPMLDLAIVLKTAAEVLFHRHE